MAPQDGAAATLDRLREIAGGRVMMQQHEAMTALGVTRRRLIEECSSGRLSYVMIGKRRRFRPTDLAAYIEQQVHACPLPTGTHDDRLSDRGRGRPSGTRTSPSTVVDFETALARTPARTQRPRPSLPTPRQKPDTSPSGDQRA